jgi:hypothetical protein
MMYGYWEPLLGLHPLHKIYAREFEDWFAKKQTLFYQGDAPQLSRETRPMVFASEYTLKVSRDVANQPIKRKSYLRLGLAAS